MTSDITTQNPPAPLEDLGHMPPNMLECFGVPQPPLAPDEIARGVVMPEGAITEEPKAPAARTEPLPAPEGQNIQKGPVTSPATGAPQAVPAEPAGDVTSPAATAETPMSEPAAAVVPKDRQEAGGHKNAVSAEKPAVVASPWATTRNDVLPSTASHSRSRHRFVKEYDIEKYEERVYGHWAWLDMMRQMTGAGLPPLATMMFQFILWGAYDNLKSTVSTSGLANSCGLALNTAKNHIRLMREIGFIKVVSSSNAGSRYQYMKFDSMIEAIESYYATSRKRASHKKKEVVQ